jgi:uncharacterized protein (TIGR02118 family)
MLKIIEFLTRRRDMTHDESMKYWTEHHAKLVKKETGGVTAMFYSNNVGKTVDPNIASILYTAPYDGIVAGRVSLEIEEMKQGLSPDSVIIQDEPNFLGCRPVVMICDEIVQKDLHRPYRTKLFMMLTRRHDLKQDAAMRYWKEKHVPLVMQIYGDKLIKFTTNVGKPVRWGPWGEEMPPYDGVAEYWFDLSIENLAKEIREQTAIAQDAQVFTHNIFSMLVEEVIQEDRK